MATPKDDGERLAALSDAIAESVADASDEVLLQEAKEAGRDPAKVQAHVQQLLRGSVLAFKKQRLVQADAEHKKATAAISARPVSLPKDAATRRLLLNSVFARQPQLQQTLQFRELGELTDEDVESMLLKLSHLGVLDKG